MAQAIPFITNQKNGSEKSNLNTIKDRTQLKV